MLPVILGGVALIATGYGIRAYMEEDCSNEYSSRNDDVYKNGSGSGLINPYGDLLMTNSEQEDNLVSELYDSNRRLKDILERIENLKSINYLEFNDIKFYGKNELNEKMKVYANINKKIVEYIDIRLEVLEIIVDKSDDFNSYEKLDKEFVKNLVSISLLIDKIIKKAKNLPKKYEKLESLIS